MQSAQVQEKRTREEEGTIKSQLIAKIGVCCSEYEKLLINSKKEEDKNQNIYAIQLPKGDIKQFQEERLKPLEKQIRQDFKKMDMISLADLLQFPLLPLLMASKHTITTTREPKKQCVDVPTIILWDNFIPEVNSTLSELEEIFFEYAQYIPTVSIVVSEKDVELAWIMAVADFINRIIDKGKFGINSKGREVVGDPDFIFLDEEHVKAIGELKTWWAFPFDNLVLECQKKNRNNSVWKAILQLYGYMTYNQLRYGFLTNYVHTWFFCRVATNGSSMSPLEV